MDHGHARATIVVADGTAPAVLETARDIYDIIERMSGAAIPVVTGVPSGTALVME